MKERKRLFSVAFSQFSEFTMHEFDQEFAQTESNASHVAFEILMGDQGVTCFVED